MGGKVTSVATHDVGLWQHAPQRRQYRLQRPQSTWQSRVGHPTRQISSLDNALGQLRALKNTGDIEPSVAVRAAEILHQIMSRDSVPPAAVPEGDGGCSLYWVAGRETLELAVDLTAGVYCRVTRPDGSLALAEDFESTPFRDLRQWLATFSQGVAARNPSWRQNFALK